MSTLSVATLQSNATTPPVIKNSSGIEIGTFCRAWVNFNGTGTIAIRGSFNVSSITDNGVGDYTVNFTNAMPDTNYGISLSATDDGTTTSGLSQTTGFSYGSWKRGSDSTLHTTTSMRFQIGYSANANFYDQTDINFIVFR